jgi:hypothetical protein
MSTETKPIARVTWADDSISVLYTDDDWRGATSSTLNRVSSARFRAGRTVEVINVVFAEPGESLPLIDIHPINVL